MKLKVLLLILLSSLMFGCATVQEPIYKVDRVEKPKLDLPMPKGVDAQVPYFYVMTEKNAPEVWAKLRQQNIDESLICMSDDGYEGLSLTMADMKRYIKELQEITKQYRLYYESDEPVTDKDESFTEWWNRWVKKK